MSTATRIYLLMIDSGLAWIGQINAQQQTAIAHQASKRHDEDQRFARRRAQNEEHHAQDMKVLEARRAALLRQELDDRRKEQEALRAWRDEPSDRRER